MTTQPLAPLRSRLPEVGTTIFTVMSALAQEHGAVNLGQGFPDFDCDPRLTAAVTRAMQSGLNQYPPMTGLPGLRQQIADKIAQLHGARPHPDSEITVTAGATQALLCAILAIVHPGDEVIILEPAYDSYRPAITLAGGTTVAIPLTAQYSIPWDRVAAAITPRTRAILVNSPHNPSGRILEDADLATLAALVRQHDLTVISDEVYEHMVYDGKPHRSLSGHPELASRSLVISSFGKTFHVTGWKVGYCVAPAALTAEFRKIHQYTVFTVNTPAQAGIAWFLEHHPEQWRNLPAFYQARRDLFLQGLAGSGFELLPCQGSYFAVASYRGIRDVPEAEFAHWLTTEHGVTGIPMSAFHHDGTDRRQIRFCFAKQESTLERALQRLRAL